LPAVDLDFVAICTQTIKNIRYIHELNKLIMKSILDVYFVFKI